MLVDQEAWICQLNSNTSPAKIAQRKQTQKQKREPAVMKAHNPNQKKAHKQREQKPMDPGLNTEPKMKAHTEKKRR